ncbi:MAG: thiamine pyrophosphate-binding protein [Chloroflexi bacterium]|nr:thiamine pyrophosphate-binding protein [Chloroflexota bacterium]
MAEMTGGQAVVASLRGQGVDTVFGIISVHMLDVYDALYDARDSPSFIGGRHEQAIAYMADGYARASGKPGVLLSSTGPGAANTLGALGEAYACSSPVLNITSNVEAAQINSGRGSLHEPKDQLAMFRSVTGWNALIPRVESIPDHVHQAFRRFHTLRPRPIELEVPVDVLAQRADVEIPNAVEHPRRQGDSDLVERAARMLAEAQRPAIWAGGGVISADASQELIQLCELLECPATTTYGGKGAIPDDHPLALGCSLGGRVYGQNPIRDFLADCDCLLVVGSSLPYRTTAGVGLKLPRRIVHVDIDSQVFGKTYPPELEIEADARAVLAQLVHALQGKGVGKSERRLKEIQDMKAQAYRYLQEEGPNQQRTMDALRAVMPRDTIIVCDSTVPAYWGSRGMPAYQPRTYIAPHGWSSVGFGFPAALGAKVAHPDRHVVAIVGDGGFQFNVQELGTAVQYGINVTVLVFNDSAWGVLKGMQKSRYRERYFATDLQNPDFVKLAESYGVPATRVHTLEELTTALEKGLQSRALNLIEVVMPQGFAEFR